MTARVLVVEDIPANRKLLEVKLTAEYFDVVTAANGHEALTIAETTPCDIILLDVMMPGMDGFETCRRLKKSPQVHHVPVVMVTALDQPGDRLKGLEAGADDFITKPFDDTALIARVRSLSRLKLAMDELRMRAAGGQQLGFGDPLAVGIDVNGEDGRVLLVEDRETSAERIVEYLSRHHAVETEDRPEQALFRIADGGFDVVVISLDLDGFDALRLCSQMRSLERTRTVPIVLLTHPEAKGRVMRGLDIGVNDYIQRPVDRNELLARIRTQVKRKRYSDRLRDNVELSVTMALTDPLTGLHNRRYLEAHLEMLVSRTEIRGQALSAMILDIDHFKAINDTYGHKVGDRVLTEFADRVRKSIRGIDLACRFGGEEFVVIMPETPESLAIRVGERIRRAIAEAPFRIDDLSGEIEITVSIGVAAYTPTDNTPDNILRRADQALYAAKREGRNRVVSQAA